MPKMHFGEKVPDFLGTRKVEKVPDLVRSYQDGNTGEERPSSVPSFQRN